MKGTLTKPIIKKIDEQLCNNYEVGNVEIVMMNAHGYPSNRLNQEKEKHIGGLLKEAHIAVIMETGVNQDHQI